MLQPRTARRPRLRQGDPMPVPLPPLATMIVGSLPQPDWLIDRDRLRHQFPPRVRARELWRGAPPLLPGGGGGAPPTPLPAPGGGGGPAPPPRGRSPGAPSHHLSTPPRRPGPATPRPGRP